MILNYWGRKTRTNAVENKGCRVSRYDEDLDRLNNKITTLLAYTRDALKMSLEALSERNSNKARLVVHADESIDNLDLAIQHDVFDLIIRYQPVSIDLRNILGSMRISGDLERIGDNAKSLAKRALALNQSQADAPRRLVALGEAVLCRFNALIEAYLSRSADAAGEIWKLDCDIDAAFLDAYADIVEIMENDPSLIRPGAQLLSIAKSLERVGDHLTNVAEQILFEVDGRSDFSGRPRVEAIG